MRAYYVDLVRGSALDFIAGPFANEAIARKYQHAAVFKQVEIDPWDRFDEFGVSSVEGGFCPPGRLNELLELESDDLLSQADLDQPRAFGRWYAPQPNSCRG